MFAELVSFELQIGTFLIAFLWYSLHEIKDKRQGILGGA